MKFHLSMDCCGSSTDSKTVSLIVDCVLFSLFINDLNHSLIVSEKEDQMVRH